MRQQHYRSRGPHNHTVHTHFASQWRQVARAHELALETSAAAGCGDYDAEVRLRADLFLLSPLPVAELIAHAARRAFLAVPRCCDDDYIANELDDLDYVPGRHQTSTQLHDCFLVWANAHNLMIEWTDRQFFLKLAEFARNNPSLLKESHSNANGKGYIIR